MSAYIYIYIYISHYQVSVDDDGWVSGQHLKHSEASRLDAQEIGMVKLKEKPAFASERPKVSFMLSRCEMSSPIPHSTDAMRVDAIRNQSPNPPWVDPKTEPTGDPVARRSDMLIPLASSGGRRGYSTESRAEHTPHLMSPEHTHVASPECLFVSVPSRQAASRKHRSSEWRDSGTWFYMDCPSNDHPCCWVLLVAS